MLRTVCCLGSKTQILFQLYMGSDYFSPFVMHLSDSAKFLALEF